MPEQLLLVLLPELPEQVLDEFGVKDACVPRAVVEDADQIEERLSILEEPAHVELLHFHVIGNPLFWFEGLDQTFAALDGNHAI